MQNSFFYSQFQRQSDGYPSGFVIPPLILPNYFQQPFIQSKIENFSNQSFIEPSAFLNLQNQDTFFYNVNEDSKLNPVSIDDQNNVHLSNHEITIEPDFMTKSKEYAMDYFQTCRSKGPSFCLGKTKKENQDFLSPSRDILSYFENEPNNSLTMKSKTLESSVDDFITTDRSNSPQTNSPRMLSIGCNNSTEGPIHAKVDHFLFDKTSLCHNSFNSSSSPPVRKNQNMPTSVSLAVQKSKTTSRKKRKTGKNNDLWFKDENLEGLPSGLKLKKSKSEFYNNTLNTVNTNTSMPLKDFKNPFVFINTASCNILSEGLNEKPQLEAAVFERIEKDEKLIDISPSRSIQPLFENSPKTLNISSNVLSYHDHTQVSTIPSCNFLTKIPNTEAVPQNTMNFVNPDKGHSAINKKIGTLTVEERKVKIEKYLEKRKQRTWSKKISYDCRKRVADSRLRIRGRFVTKSQAFAILEADGILYDPNTITLDEIKEYLTKKFGENQKVNDFGKRRYFEGEDSFIFETKEEDKDEEGEENERDFYFEMKEEILLSPVRFSDGKIPFPYE